MILHTKKIYEIDRELNDISTEDFWKLEDTNKSILYYRNLEQYQNHKEEFQFQFHTVAMSDFKIWESVWNKIQYLKQERSFNKEFLEYINENS